MSDRCEIASDRLRVAVTARGAELVSLSHADAGELLWDAGPIWPRHAPVLFPIVGALANDALRHDGRSYPLSKHGFARDRDFAWTERGPAACALELVDDAATLARYPFRFALRVRYAIEGATLATTFEIENPGATVLPASIGAHPAFRWPLAAGVAKEAHTLAFATDEPEPIRRLAGDVLDARPFATPIRGRVLTLAPALFEPDAVVMDHPRSTSLRYAGPGTPVVDVAWTGFRQLGIWSKLPGNFLCIEPWYGYADPAGFDGDFVDKPGLAHVAPGATARFEMRVTVSLPESGFAAG